MRRHLSGGAFGLVRLVATYRDLTDVVLVFGTAALSDLVVNGEDMRARIETIPGGARVRLRAPQGNLDLSIDGEAAIVGPVSPERAAFAGKRVLLGLRHAESAGVAAAWALYHARHQGAEAALILDCGDPAERDAFARDLGVMLADSALDPVMIVTTEAPLGRTDLPSAGHPFNAPAAPGKARMADIAPDPVRAPLAETVVFEVLRRLYLNNALAVLSLDVSDLALPCEAGTVFDRVLALQGGYLSLPGQEAYPWRLRQRRPCEFGDHICTQFDAGGTRRRWAVAPARVPLGTWRMTRLAEAPAQEDATGFLRCVALRHPGVQVAALVPKTSLVEDPALVAFARDVLGGDPPRAPEVGPRRSREGEGHVTVVTCMKNEGPFILEWLAYHKAIGIDRFLVYSNDCTDGTDRMLELLAARGVVEHRDNPYRRTGQRPQHAALVAAEHEPIVEDADWLIAMDVDEFVNIHVGAGRIDDLLRAVGDANMISMTWRLFGNADIAAFEDVPVTRQFTACAPVNANKPHQSWGFKTLFRHEGLFRKLGVHRPKGLVPQLKDRIRWVNGSGRPMPETAYRNAWRSTSRTVGYDLVTLNHYAVRSVESFLVKRDRGRVNHVDRDQGLLYWFRMNNNAESDSSILRRLAAMEAELARLKADPEIASAHQASVALHRRRIAELLEQEDYAAFHAELVGDRMRRLSRLLPHFGAGVFWTGPHCVPDEIAMRDPSEHFFFTAPAVGRGH